MVDHKFSFVIIEDDDLLGGLLDQWLLREFPGAIVRRHLNVAHTRTNMTTWLDEIDVLIIDVRLPDGDGVDLAVEVRQKAKRMISTVIISGRPTPGLFNQMAEALNSGWSFILKQTSGLDNLRQAISVAKSGLVMVDPHLHGASGSSDITHLLTDNERAVLKLVAEGKSNKTIAEELFSSEKTVERHLTAVYHKLDLDGKSKVVNQRVVASLRYLELI